MARNALAVLEEAAKLAHDEPIPLTPAIRLAIGWLLLDEIAEYRQVEFFTKAMTRPVEPSQVFIDGYVRRRDMAIYLRRWCEDAEKWRG